MHSRSRNAFKDATSNCLHRKITSMRPHVRCRSSPTPGTACHRWERRLCSMPRRHQKLVANPLANVDTTLDREGLAKRGALSIPGYTNPNRRVPRRQVPVTSPARGQRPAVRSEHPSPSSHRHRPDQRADSRRRRRPLSSGKGREADRPREIECRSRRDPARTSPPSPGLIQNVLVPGGLGSAGIRTSMAVYGLPPN